MDAASSDALAWFNVREPGATAIPCPACPPSSERVDRAAGYFTSPAALARHLRTIHGRTGPHLEVT